MKEKSTFGEDFGESVGCSCMILALLAGLALLCMGIGGCLYLDLKGQALRHQSIQIEKTK